MHIIEFYGIDQNLNICYDRKPHTICVHLENAAAPIEDNEVIDPDDLEEWVKEHPKFNGYWERCVNIEDDWNEGELDDMGFVQGRKSKIKVLDWDAFLQELDNAVIIEYLKQNTK